MAALGGVEGARCQTQGLIHARRTLARRAPGKEARCESCAGCTHARSLGGHQREGCGTAATAAATTAKDPAVKATCACISHGSRCQRTRAIANSKLRAQEDGSCRVQAKHQRTVRYISLRILCARCASLVFFGTCVGVITALYGCASCVMCAPYGCASRQEVN